MSEPLTPEQRVAEVLAAHFSPDQCVRAGHMRSDVPMVAEHTAHVAAALAEEGLLAAASTQERDPWIDPNPYLGEP